MPARLTPEEQAARCEARIKAARRARAGLPSPADVPDWIEPIPDTFDNIMRAAMTAPPEKVETRLRGRKETPHE